MNGEDTLALWRQGKSAWESWTRARLEKKAALMEARSWLVDWYGEGQNDETKAWLQDATADFSKAVFEDDADFSGYDFPGPAIFEGASFAGAAKFAGATFSDNASFDRAQFAASSFAAARFCGFASFIKTRFNAQACFEKAEFLKVSDLAPCVCFRSAQFAGAAEFAGARFAGAAEFPKAAFASARFDQCEFLGAALFASAQFTEAASFSEAHFGGSWAGLVTSGSGCVSFESARFERGASFRHVWFVGESQFKDAAFLGEAAFDKALFVMPASFAPVVFEASASFVDSQFDHDANFTGAQFLGACDCAGAKFNAEARFLKARFVGAARFERARFMGVANFRGVVAELALALDGAGCVATPDFAEGVFAQAPSLDKLVTIKQKRGLFRWLEKRRPAPPRLLPPKMVGARKTAEAQKPESQKPVPLEPSAPADEPDAGVPERPIIIRKTSAAAVIAASAKPPEEPVEELASAGQTGEEQSLEPAARGAESDVVVLEFPASARKISVTPIATSAQSTEKPAAALERSVMFPEPVIVWGQGVAAQSQNIAVRKQRSVLRPLLVWILVIVAFTPFYLSQNPATPFDASVSVSGALASGSLSDGLASLAQAALDAVGSHSCVQGHSHPVVEAVFLSAKNALVIVPWESEYVMRRVYGCLYGLEGAAPVIPAAVSLGLLLQSVLSFMLLAFVFIALAERLKRK